MYKEYANKLPDDQLEDVSGGVVWSAAAVPGKNTEPLSFWNPAPAVSPTSSESRPAQVLDQAAAQGLID